MPAEIKELINTALIFHQSGQLYEAEKNYLEVLKNSPDNPDALNLLGLLKLQSNLLDEAEAYIKKAVEVKPSLYFYENLGRVYYSARKFSDAITAFKKALELDSGNFEIWFGLALAYKNDQKIDEAISAYQKAISIKPDSYDAYFNLAYLYLCKSEPYFAIDCYKKSLELKPDDSESEYFLSLAYLQVKDYENGLKLYESRLCRESSIITQEMMYPNIVQRSPIWQGEAIDDKTIYTYYEAGFGDMIMFARYLPLLKQRCKKVLFKPHTQLVNLFKENSLGAEIIEGIPPEKDMDFDVHIPIMSVPLALGLKGDEVFVSPEGYMNANPEKTKSYKEKYFDNDKFKIGIKWQGNTYYDMGRVITVESFFKLFDLPNTQFYSAQTFEGAEALNKLSEKYDIIDLGKTFRDFSDTAGAIENFDLVICNDTSLAHLAGAMGKPCWILLPFAYNWRWHMDLNHCDWYNSVKLFRQIEPDNWDEVFDRVHAELKNLLSGFQNG